MRVYIDSRINVFYIETVSYGPVTDYVVSANGNNISIYRTSLKQYDIYQVPYTVLTDQNGNSFTDVNAAVNYLTALTVYQGPITAIYPLQLNTSNNNLSLDKTDVTDGGNY